MPPSQQPTSTDWYLEGYLDQSKVLQRAALMPLPFRIGRRPDMDLPLPFSSVSGAHAQITAQPTGLHISDLGSLNGTFVNRVKVEEEQILREGDILHLGDQELRVGHHLAEQDPMQTIAMSFSDSGLPRRMVTGTWEFRQLLENEAVISLFQPIVSIPSGEIYAYEALGRGGQEGLGESPYELFRIAATLGLEGELSRLFRRVAVHSAQSLPAGMSLSVNTHPAEMSDDLLLPSLKEIREAAPDISLILEVHEAAIADPGEMAKLHAHLKDLSIELAYDDFGAGQARLVELVEAPPDMLKFDIQLIRNLHVAPESRKTMVEALVKMATDLGIVCLAEGIECIEEAEACTKLGFRLAQGYHYGRPAPLPE